MQLKERDYNLPPVRQLWEQKQAVGSMTSPPGFPSVPSLEGPAPKALPPRWPCCISAPPSSFRPLLPELLPTTGVLPVLTDDSLAHRRLRGCPRSAPSPLLCHHLNSNHLDTCPNRPAGLPASSQPETRLHQDLASCLPRACCPPLPACAGMSLAAGHRAWALPTVPPPHPLAILLTLVAPLSPCALGLARAPHVLTLSLQPVSFLKSSESPQSQAS